MSLQHCKDDETSKHPYRFTLLYLIAFENFLLIDLKKLVATIFIIIKKTRVFLVVHIEIVHIEIEKKEGKLYLQENT